MLGMTYKMNLYKSLGLRRETIIIINMEWSIPVGIITCSQAPVELNSVSDWLTQKYRSNLHIWT